MPEPEGRDEDRQSAGDERGPVHHRKLERRRVREAEDHDEGDDVQAANRVNDVTGSSAHPEPTRRHVGAAAEQMGQDGTEVRESREDYERPDEGVEGDWGPDEDTAHERADDAAEERCVEGIVEGRMDLGKEAAERGGVVPRERPERSTCRDITSDAVNKRGQKGHDKKTDSSRIASCRLAVDIGQRKGRGCREDRVQVLDGVEDGDEVQEGSDEADDKLSQHGFWDIAARAISGVRRKLRKWIRDAQTYFGISSARCETQSGVPTAKAPLSIPATKTNPLLV